jgi:predicted ester cyclase
MVLPEPVRAAMAGGDPEAGFEALMRDLELWDALDHATRQRMLGNADLFFTYESGLLQSYRPDDALLTANRVPVQVGAGEAAPPLFREMAGWLASRLMVRVETYPGGHAAASTHPDEVSRVIRPFLQSKRVDKVGGAPMSDPRALFERLLAAINAHDLQAASGFISPDCEIVTPFATLRGPEPFKTYVKGLIDAFPDFMQTVHNTVCEGSTLVTEWTLTGTHLGPMRMPNGSLLPPTGKKMNAHGCDVYKWEGGQVMADRIYRDRLETLIQLGLSPDPAAARA